MPLPINCPLCQAGHKTQNVITPHVYGGDQDKSFFKCTECDVIYLYNQLTVEEEARFYRAEFESFMSNRAGVQAGWKTPDMHVEANQPQFIRRMRYLEKHLPKDKSGGILEIGCSSGFMLLPLIEQGYQCLGVEPSAVFPEFLKTKGVECLSSTEELATTNLKFDLIMHYFVLEHIREPLNFIEDNLKYLNKGGKLVIEIPNAADPLYTIYDIPAFERFFWSIAHHWYFSKQSFQYLLNKVDRIDYEIILDQRYDLSNHMVWARDGKPGGMSRFSKKFGEELEEQYKQALIQSGHCDTLIGVITKQ